MAENNSRPLVWLPEDCQGLVGAGAGAGAVFRPVREVEAEAGGKESGAWLRCRKEPRVKRENERLKQRRLAGLKFTKTALSRVLCAMCNGLKRAR